MVDQWALRAPVCLSVLAVGVLLAKPAGAVDPSVVLGFESSSSWSSVAPLSTSSTASEGVAALGVLPSGWTEINSVLLSSLGTVADSFSFDIRLPAAAPWGEVGVVLVLPSQQIYWQELGRKSLIGMPAGAYQTVTFGIPASVKAALQGSYADLRVKIIVNAPSLGAPVLLDRGSFGGGSGSGGSGGGGGSDDQFVSVPLFGNTLYPHVALGSRTSMRLGQRVEIDGGVVVSLGTDTSHVFEEVLSPTIYSAGPIEVFGSQIQGSLFTESTATFFNGAGVEGALVQGSELGRRELEAINVTFPNDVSANPLTATNLVLAPGRYGSLGLKSNQSLKVSTGTYYFDEVMTEPGALIEVDDTHGAVRWIVDADFTHRATFVSGSGEPAQFGVIYLGSSPAFLESPFMGSFLAPNAELTLGGASNGIAFQGSFYGDRLLVRPDTKIHFIPPYAFGRPRVSGTPVADLVPIPGGPSILHCAPQLQLNDLQEGSDGEVFYGSLSYSGSTCPEPLLFCDAEGNVIPAPTEAQLNANANEACDAIGGGSSFGCSIDPLSLGATCASDADCTGTQVCAEVCANPTCSEMSNRCGNYYESCAGIPAESSGCQAEPFYECAGEGFAGTLDLAATIASTPEQVDSIPESLSIPPEDVIEVQPYVTAAGGFCALPEPFQELTVVTADEKDEGSDKVGFKLEALNDVTSNLETKDFFGEGRFSFMGEFGVKGVLKLFGFEVDVFSAGVGLGVEPCGFAADLPVRLFGERISINGLIDATGALASGDTDIELNDVFVTRDDGSLETPDFGSEECNNKFKSRDDKAANVRKAAFVAENVKEFYKEHGATIDLCERTNEELGTSFDCLDPDTLENDVTIREIWAEDYEFKAEDLISTQKEIDADKQNYSAAINLNLVDIGDNYSLGGFETVIPVGPVGIVLAAEAWGGWRVAGKVQVGMDYTGQVPFADAFTQVDDDETVPFDGSKTFVPLDGDLGFFAGPVIVPGVELSLVVFAGVGIPGVAIGVEGDVLVLRVTQPTDMRVNLVRQALDDPRNVEASDWAGEPFEDGPPHKVYDWKWGLNYGSRIDLESLTGKISLAARVKVLFAKKTFRKKLFDWQGYKWSFFLVGGELAGEPGNPLRGETLFGTYGDPIALSKLPRLTDDDEVLNPDAEAVYPGLLGNEPCIVIEDPE